MAESSDSKALSSKDVKDRAQQARDDLTHLHEAVIEAEERVISTHTAELLEANEQLVVSTLQAHRETELTTKKLQAASLPPPQLDVLTELPNRNLLRDRFGQALIDAGRNKELLALLFLDLDNFKQINDTVGHAVGDTVLRQVAQCFVSAVRAGDTVSREGGDEFLILLPRVTRVADAGIVAEKLIAALGRIAPVEGSSVTLSASIGISVYPVDGNDIDILINRADEAMYAAKKHGGRKFAFHGHDPKSTQSVPPLQGLEVGPEQPPAAPHLKERRRS